jgi:hypothetical protein
VKPIFTSARVFLIIVVAVQLLFFLRPHLGPEPYRLYERTKAFADWKRLGTHESKETFDAEVAAVNRHIMMRSALLIGSFFLIDAFLCYVLWNYGGPKKEALTA